MANRKIHEDRDSTRDIARDVERSQRNPPSPDSSTAGSSAADLRLPKSHPTPREMGHKVPAPKLEDRVVDEQPGHRKAATRRK